jgi:hypothetical protein
MIANYPNGSALDFSCCQTHLPSLKIRHPPDRRTECTMADDTAKRVYRDHNRINIHEDYELRYWTKELGVTPEKLRQTVERVGVMATEARKAFGK